MNRLRPTLVALAAVATGLAVQSRTATGQSAPRPVAPIAPITYEWFDPIIDLRQLVESGYVEQPDAAAMQEAALAAMVAALNDPYSVYVPPSGERNFNKALRGTYVGIGAEIDMPDGWLRVVAPIDDSPAEEAGVLPGDIVLSIDGTATRGKSIEECMDLLLGEPGTEVRVEVRHPGGREEVLTIPRREIRAKAIKGIRRDSDGWEFRIDPQRGIAYVRLTQFLEESAEELGEVLRTLEEGGLKGLILDLRYNGGGALGAAIRVVDLFQSDGGIVSVRGRQGQERSWSAGRDGDEFEIPIVILVNEASASASEIVAGALQENGRAKVLGTRTYGKGTVQDVRGLGEGRGSVKLTIARYHLPSGRSIARTSASGAEGGGSWGVDPDPGFHVPLDEDVARRLFLTRRTWELPLDQPADTSRFNDPEWIARDPGESKSEGLGDPQLAAALTALQGYLDGGVWPRVGDDPTPATVAGDELRRQEAYRTRLARELEAVERRIADLRLAVSAYPLDEPSK